MNENLCYFSHSHSHQPNLNWTMHNSHGHSYQPNLTIQSWLCTRNKKLLNIKSLLFQGGIEYHWILFCFLHGNSKPTNKQTHTPKHKHYNNNKNNDVKWMNDIIIIIIEEINKNYVTIINIMDNINRDHHSIIFYIISYFFGVN